MGNISKVIGGLRVTAAPSPLGTALLKLRPSLAVAAQTVLDAWKQDDEGFDEQYGHGGICDDIARAMSEVIQIPGVEITEGGQDGDDHAWLIAYTDQEAYGIDIPPGVYETGGGYNWRKIPGAHIQPNDVEIFKLNRADLGHLDDY